MKRILLFVLTNLAVMAVLLVTTASWAWTASSRPTA
jgi:hypothetical protein